MKKSSVMFLMIVILAAVLRLFNLSNFPVGFNADEAALGYNAYSLLQTGKDEYGASFPLAFKSFGDFKPGLYVYFVMPFVSVLGLNEWAVRLPSAFLGIGTVILIYFLSRKIFSSETVGLLSALLLAVSPWHLHFSRGGWETNAATFFITLGVFLFLKTLEERRYFFWSMLSFLISMYLYQSPRLVVPVLVVALIILYSGYFKRVAGQFIRPGLVLAALSIPLLLQFTGGAGGARFSGLSFYADPGPASRVNELRGQHADLGGKDAALLHNKFTAYAPNFLGHYLDHFTPNFLFINGDPLIRNRVPETGQFYLITSIFLIAGLFSLIKKRFEHTKLLIAWILIAPLASAMTYQTPHALRALNMVVPLTLIMGYGLWVMGNFLRGRVRYLLLGAIVVLLSFEIIHYLESYYIHYPKRYPLAWEYGFKEMTAKLEQYQNGYNQVVITDRYDQPYILVLFYRKYDPSKYQPQAVLSERDKFNFGTVRSFDKYEFRSIKSEEVRSNSGTLFIGTSQEIPEDAKIIDRVNFPNNDPAFVFAEGG